VNFINFLLLGLFVISALWSVLTPTLLRGAIGLAAASAVLTLLMFQMEAPLAGVFELSVCAGLITVVFVSAISLTTPKDKPEARERREARARTFIPGLFLALAQVGLLVWLVGMPALPGAASAKDTAKPAASAAAKSADAAKAAASKTPAMPAGKVAVAGSGPAADVRTVLWGERRLDLLGQILIIFAGVFGVVILFRDERTRAKVALPEADKPEVVRLRIAGQFVGELPMVPEKLEGEAEAAPAEVTAKKPEEAVQ
jgi:NADH-quinone oxidoreductase subunit J